MAWASHSTILKHFIMENEGIALNKTNQDTQHKCTKLQQLKENFKIDCKQSLANLHRYTFPLVPKI